MVEYSELFSGLFGSSLCVLNMKCIYLLLILIAIVGLSRSDDDADPAVMEEVRERERDFV